MKRSKLLGLAFMAILALTSITAATATAAEEELPNILPLSSAGNEVTSTSLSAESVFGSAGIASITSSSSLGTSIGTSTQLGTFHTDFLNVKQAILGLCTGLEAGDTNGQVLVLGEFHVVDVDIAELLKVGILFLINPQVEFVCGGTTIAVTGCAEGQLTPENELTSLLLINLETSGNDNLMTSYLVSGKTELCLLLAKKGAGGTELSAEKTLQDLSGFRQAGLSIMVLVMPL